MADVEDRATKAARARKQLKKAQQKRKAAAVVAANTGQTDLSSPERRTDLTPRQLANTGQTDLSFVEQDQSTEISREKGAEDLFGSVDSAQTPIQVDIRRPDSPRDVSSLFSHVPDPSSPSKGFDPFSSFTASSFNTRIGDAHSRQSPIKVKAAQDGQQQQHVPLASGVLEPVDSLFSPERAQDRDSSFLVASPPMPVDDGVSSLFGDPPRSAKVDVFFPRAESTPFHADQEVSDLFGPRKESAEKVVQAEPFDILQAKESEKASVSQTHSRLDSLPEREGIENLFDTSAKGDEAVAYLFGSTGTLHAKVPQQSVEAKSERPKGHDPIVSPAAPSADRNPNEERRGLASLFAKGSASAQGAFASFFSQPENPSAGRDRREVVRRPSESLSQSIDRRETSSAQSHLADSDRKSDALSSNQAADRKGILSPQGTEPLGGQDPFIHLAPNGESSFLPDRQEREELGDEVSSLFAPQEGKDQFSTLFSPSATGYHSQESKSTMLEEGQAHERSQSPHSPRESPDRALSGPKTSIEEASPVESQPPDKRKAQDTAAKTIPRIDVHLPTTNADSESSSSKRSIEHKENVSDGAGASQKQVRAVSSSRPSHGRKKTTSFSSSHTRETPTDLSSSALSHARAHSHENLDLTPLRKQLVSQQVAINALSNEKAALQQRIEVLETDAQSRSLVEDLKPALNALEQDKEQLQSRLHALQATIEAQNNQITDLQGQIVGHSTQKLALQEEIEDGKRLQLQSSETATLREGEAKEGRATLAAVQKQLDVQQKTLQATEKEVNLLKTEIEEQKAVADSEKAQLQRSLEEQKANQASASEAFEAELARWRGKESEADALAKELETLKEKLSEQDERKTSSLATTLKALEAQRQANEDLSRELQEQRNQNDLETAKSAATQAELEAQLSEWRERGATFAEAERTLEALKRQLGEQGHVSQASSRELSQVKRLLEEQTARLKTATNAHVSEVSQWKGKLAKADESYKLLREQTDDVMNRLAYSYRDMDANQLLADQGAKAVKESETLRKQLDALAEEHKKEADLLNKQMAVLRSQMAEREAIGGQRQASLQNELVALRKRHQSDKEALTKQFEQDRSSENDQVEALKTKLAHSNELNASLQQKLAQASPSGTQTRSKEQEEETERTCTALREEISSLTNQLRDHEGISETIADYAKQITDLKSQLERFASKNTALHAEMEGLHQKHQTEKDALSKQYDEAMTLSGKQIETLKAQIADDAGSSDNKRHLELQEEFSRLRSQHEADKDNLTQQRGEDSRQIDSLKGQLSEAKQMVASLNDRCNRLREESEADMDKLSEKHESALSLSRKETVERQQRLEALQIQLSDAQRQIVEARVDAEKQLESQQKAYEERLVALEEQSKVASTKTTEEQRKLEDELKELHSSYSKSQAENDERHVKQIDALTTQLSTVRTASANELATLRTEHERERNVEHEKHAEQLRTNEERIALLHGQVETLIRTNEERNASHEQTLETLRDDSESSRVALTEEHAQTCLQYDRQIDTLKKELLQSGSAGSEQVVKLQEQLSQLHKEKEMELTDLKEKHERNLALNEREIEALHSENVEAARSHQAAVQRIKEDYRSEKERFITHHIENLRQKEEEVRTLKERLDQAERNSSQEEEVTVLHAKHAEQEKRIGELASEVASAEEEAKRSDASRKALEGEYKTDLAKAQREVASLKHDLDKADERSEELQSSLSRTEERLLSNLSERQKEIGLLKAELEEAGRDKERNEMTSSSREKKHAADREALQGECAELRKTMDSLLQEHERARSSLHARSEEETAALRLDRSKAKEEIALLKRSIEQEKEAHESAQQEKKALQASMEAVSEEHASTKQEFEQRFQGMKDTIETQERTIALLREEVQTLAADQKKERAEMESGRQRSRAESDEALVVLQKERDGLREELRLVKQTSREQVEKLKSMVDASRSSSENNLKERGSYVKSLEAKLQRQETELEEERTKRVEERREIEKRSGAIVYELEQQLAQRETALERAKTTIDELRRKVVADHSNDIEGTTTSSMQTATLAGTEARAEPLSAVTFDQAYVDKLAHDHEAKTKEAEGRMAVLEQRLAEEEAKARREAQRVAELEKELVNGAASQVNPLAFAPPTALSSPPDGHRMLPTLSLSADDLDGEEIRRRASDESSQGRTSMTLSPKSDKNVTQTRQGQHHKRATTTTSFDFLHRSPSANADESSSKGPTSVSMSRKAQLLKKANAAALARKKANEDAGAENE